MPNWATNTLTVKGAKTDLAKFVKDADGGADAEFSLDKLVPLPIELKDTNSPRTIVKDGEYAKAVVEYTKELAKYNKAKKKDPKAFIFKPHMPITAKESKRLIKKYGADNWYDWQTGNWGVKWDNSCYGRTIEKGGTVAIYDFDSPWGPPIEALDKIAVMYPTLSFVLKFSEEGMGFSGTYKWAKGKATEHCDKSWY